MNLYILSYKRDEVQTIRYIPKEWLPRTKVVVQERDKDRLKNLPCQKWVLPDHIRDIGATRQYILKECCQPKIMQMDDDLTIAVLKNRGAYNLRDADHKDMDTLLNRMESMLDVYPHVGACARNEAHLRYTSHVEECARAIRYHGFNVPWMQKLDINIDRVPTIEDYDFILQILQTGTPNALDCQVFVGDKGSNLAGGCADLRAESEDGKWAKLLQKHHPEFVSLVTKETKMPKGEIWKRTDVRVQWKKAYESGVATLAML